MKRQSQKIALCGVMSALGAAVMLMGGVIPLATFCCPMFATLALIPVLVEVDRRHALGCYAAISALSLVLCTDKEAALLFALLGYYPVLKLRLDRIKNKWTRIAAKLSVFDFAAGVMIVLMAFVLNMHAAVTEYAEMAGVVLAAFIVLANFTMLLYDRMLVVMLIVYVRKLRPKWKHSGL